jgi:hypothetical protein
MVHCFAKVLAEKGLLLRLRNDKLSPSWRAYE